MEAEYEKLGESLETVISFPENNVHYGMLVLVRFSVSTDGHPVPVLYNKIAIDANGWLPFDTMQSFCLRLTAAFFSRVMFSEDGFVSKAFSDTDVKVRSD